MLNWTLPININDLLTAHAIESDRIEFKEGWNPDTIYRSICAFANDFENIGGGYILIGVAEENGRAKRPVLGIDEATIDAIQRKMLEYNNFINPFYHPRLSIEPVDGKQILVIWVPGSTNRPHQVPDNITAKHKTFHYYVRQYASSVRANLSQQQELIAMTNQVPFDDVDPLLLRDHLRRTKSRLSSQSAMLTQTELLAQMALLDGPPERLLPRNVALMLFCEQPEQFFPYCRIDVVHFPDGEAAPTFTEQQFSGPVQHQIRDVLNYLRTQFVQELVTKLPMQAEAVRVWSYPFRALEELVANAVYHRDYQVREPIEIRVYRESVVIFNFGGPDRSLRFDALTTATVRARRYRNRRLGDFLKELDLTEGRATGLPIVQQALRDNGSPEARFETDDDRTYFLVELVRHPAFAATDPVTNLVTDSVTHLVTSPADLTDIARQILEFVAIEPRKREDILAHIGRTNQSKTYRHLLLPLEAAGLLQRTIPDKPSSSRQRYQTTPAGLAALQSNQ
jgi:ATP-dependent DNA helicase RecG